MWSVYLLHSKIDGSWYTGVTINLRKRIFIHNSKKNKSTKSKAPWGLIYYEACTNRKDAYAREKYLKSGMGKRYLKNRLKFFFSENF
jgi:putative endonuclease